MKKATKILGAVLGVLLVAALFTGAAAAADDQTLGDIYVWQIYTASANFPVAEQVNTVWTGTTWSMGTETVTFKQDPTETAGTANKWYIGGNNIAEGTYSYTKADKTYKINVKYLPAAPAGTIYSASVTRNNTGAVSEVTLTKAVADLADAQVGATDKFVIAVPKHTISSEKMGIAWVNPDGTLTTTYPAALGMEKATSVTSGDTTKFDYYVLTNANDLGDYTLMNIFLEGNKKYSTLAPFPISGEPISFELYKAADAKSLKALADAKSLKALADEVLQSGLVTVELTAPYNMDEGYKIKVDNGTIPKGQATITDDGIVKVDLSGVAYFTVKSSNTGNIKVKLMKDTTGNDVDKTLTIKVKAGVITADAASASTFIGNEVTISGYNDLGGQPTFFIKGPNFKFANIKDGAGLGDITQGKEWEAKINSAELKSNGKRPDAGNYTIYVAKLADQTSLSEDDKKAVDAMTASDLDNSKYCDAYTTVVVALKQPFINITDAPAVVVKGDHLIVKGTAEGKPADVQYYIFGTNFFKSATASVDEDGVFEINETIPDTADDMQAGQYFLVIQHKMYDEKYNVGPVGHKENKQFDTRNIVGYYILKNENGAFDAGVTMGKLPKDLTAGYVIFNTNDRQSANAAQALCDALDDQNIDDMYVKASFVVAGKTSVINPIPEQITKGQDLIISGTAVGHKNEVVTAELLSTAFAAVPKETVGSASFVSMTARVDENGLWTITIDTSDLNADDYTVSVSVGALPAESKKIKIVEGTVPQPTAQPTGEPTAQPTGEPTKTPASPGFGILAALAGLGAVAVLLLRRQ